MHRWSVHLGGYRPDMAMTPMPRHPLFQVAAYTNATRRSQRGHRRTTYRTWRNAQSPDNRTAHR